MTEAWGALEEDALRALARYAASLRLEDVPARAVALAKLALLNLLGGIAAGSDPALNPARAALLDYVERFAAVPAATVLFARRRTHPQLAALVSAGTAMASHTDDFSPRARTHASAVLGAAALAVGEERRVHGRELLAAFIAGWEVAARLGDAIRPGVEGAAKAFVSPTHTPAAAAVAARLAGLDERGIAEAIALACDMGAGLIAQAPAPVSTLRTPLGASLAVFCAELAARGMQASPRAVAAWCQAYGGVADITPLTSGLGEGCILAEDGFQLKQYQFSSGLSGLIRGLQQAQRAAGFTAAEVEAVDCWVSPAMEAVYGVVVPRSPSEAHFSIGRACALALTREQWDLADVATVPHPDPAVQRLTAAVRLHRLPGSERLTALTAAATRVEAVVRLRDGQAIPALSAPLPPITDPEREGETVRLLYRRRAQPILGAERARQLEEAVDRLDRLADIGLLTELLA
ncbi:MAG: MmgE/PrpD family protein [Chloroflexota bacterium]|nr:MmgE/PrpD family protein [Dehalococcoidia bacterium]MDW8254067.1 MmgE/PrpD family protein [Chloroflexota bacterium]